MAYNNRGNTDPGHQHEFKTEFLAYGDRVTCATCPYDYYFSIGD